MQNPDRRKPAIMSWSGGKDSCLALYELIKGSEFRIEALLTTVTRDYERISMHGVRTSLLERQARSIGIPLHPIFISKGASNAEYETRMQEALYEYRQRGVETVAFGDLFLEDIKLWRESFLARQGMHGIYPIWRRDTGQAIRNFIHLGFRTVIVCIDPKQCPAHLAGREIDRDLLSELPPDCDPCGENGEFHSFVFDGPIFHEPVRFHRGEIVERDGFCFCDLIPDE